MKPTVEELLSGLLADTVTELLKRIKDGTASPADLSVARALLRDNNITASSQPGSPMAKLGGATFSLPTVPEDALEHPDVKLN